MFLDKPDRAPQRKRASALGLVAAIGLLAGHCLGLGSGEVVRDEARHAHESEARIAVDVGHIDSTSLRWLGPLEPGETQRAAPAAAWARIEVADRSGVPSQLVAIRVSDRSLAPVSSRLASRGSTLRVDDRWVLGLEPPGADFRIFPPGAAPCAADGRGCALAVAGGSGRWLVELGDELARSPEARPSSAAQ